jgi:hypothetical protein
MIPALLATLCLAIAASAINLSATAGRLPLVVALLTLIPVVIEARQSAHKPFVPPPWRQFAGLIAGLWLIGFQIAVPLYAAWCWRENPRSAAVAAVITTLALWLIGQQVELFAGFLRDL